MYMNGIPLTHQEIIKMKSLRETGHSLPEIKVITKRGYGTIYRYIKDVAVLPQYFQEYDIKQGGSRKRANKAWNDSVIQACTMIHTPLSFEQKLCLLSGIYWGEGNKHELNLINSDPNLIKVFVSCLYDIGITKKQLKINLRLYDDIDKKCAILFWSRLLDIRTSDIGNIEIIHGKKKGKLKFGMCRVRVEKSAPHFKLIQSLIERVKSNFNAAVVQRIERGTPKP